MDWGRPASRQASAKVRLQYTSFAFTAHLLEAGIDASVVTVGDALDNALIKSQIGLYKMELIKPRRPWHGLATSNSAPRNGSTGSTTSASTPPSETPRPTSTRPTTTLSTSPNRQLDTSEPLPNPERFRLRLGKGSGVTWTLPGPMLSTLGAQT
ncbi:hypothetical protein ACPF8X_01390 [Streptomyces sp. G35A]